MPPTKDGNGKHAYGSHLWELHLRGAAKTARTADTPDNHAPLQTKKKKKSGPFSLSKADQSAKLNNCFQTSVSPILLKVWDRLTNPVSPIIDVATYRIS